MLAAFMPVAFASPCCTIDKVGEIFEDESGLKVKYVCDFKDSGKTERRVRMALIGEYTKNDYGNMVGRVINRQYQVVEQDQEYTYEVDKSMLIKGYTYEIDIDYADYCSWGACYSEFPVKYTCGYGMPEFEFNGPGKDALTLIGNDIAAVSFTADAAGYYNIGVESEYDNIDIKEYGYDYVVPGKYTYFKENETKTYVFKPRRDETLNAVVSFTDAETVPQNALKEPPLSDGDVCYRMNGSGLMSFEISQRGVYRFNVDGEAEYTVENANHETVYRSYWEPDIILEAGIYYIYNDSDEEGTVTITYTEPETVEFGKQYSYPVSENEQFERYFTINVSQPALLTLDDSSNVSIFALRRNDEENDIEINAGGTEMEKVHSIDVDDDQFAYRYDTQLLIDRRDEGLDEDEISDYISEHFEGNCLIAVGDEDLIKIHFHTNEPRKVLEYCNSIGEIYDIVVEDMIRQSAGLKG